MEKCSNFLETCFKNDFDEDIYQFLDKFNLSTVSKIMAISRFSYSEGFSKGYESNVKRDSTFRYTKGYCNALDEVANFIKEKLAEVD